MKITFITEFDPNDVRAWSGTVSYMYKGLVETGVEINTIGELKETNSFLLRNKNRFYQKILSKKYLKDRDTSLLKGYAQQIEHLIEDDNSDILFSPGTIPIAYLETDKPIVIWADATFAGMVDYYEEFTNLCSESIRDGNKMEALALSKVSLAIYSSEWAAQTAIKNYNIDEDKVKVVPFGANIECNRSIEDIRNNTYTKNFDVCKLLFLGVDWDRKGGDKALSVANYLNEKGIKTELHVVGCTPSGSLPEFVNVHGFISKSTPEGRAYINKLMSESHFLILPTKAECYGVVFVEASSFGLPSLTTNVGGVPTIINDGKNGHLFSLNDGPEKYYEFITELMQGTHENYSRLCLSSFEEYSERLNWSKSVREVISLIENKIV